MIPELVGTLHFNISMMTTGSEHPSKIRFSILGGKNDILHPVCKNACYCHKREVYCLKASPLNILHTTVNRGETDCLVPSLSEQ